MNNDVELSDDDAYMYAILPFTKHEKSNVDFAIDLIYYANEAGLSQKHLQIIKTSQIMWVNALIKDVKCKVKLIDVIKMKNNFLIEYERGLVESAVEIAVGDAVESNNRKIAREMEKKIILVKTFLNSLV